MLKRKLKPQKQIIHAYLFISLSREKEWGLFSD